MQGSSYSSGEDDEQITDERKADHHVEANEEQIKNEPKFKLLSISSEVRILFTKDEILSKLNSMASL